MARPKSAFALYAEYLPLRALFAFLGALPLSWAEACGRALVGFLLFFVPKRRRILNANLARAFPEWSDGRRRAIARQSIANLGRGVGVFAHIPRIARRGFLGTVDVEGAQYIEEAKKKGRGVMVFTAHYGCWELAGACIPALFPIAAMLVRPLDNPKLEALVAGVRSSGGGIVIPKRQLMKQGLRLLRNNGILGILVDQNFAGGGVFVDFFGQSAATTTVVSLIARRTGSPVISMHSRWGAKKLRIIFGPPLPLSDHPDAEQAVAEDTQRITAIVEGWIREDPGQWLWLHNRWKRQPQPGDFVYAPGKNTIRPSLG